MPSSWLNVPHFHQEHDDSCVAACIRMVLAHYNDIRTEAELRLLLDTQPTGTRAGNVLRLSGFAGLPPPGDVGGDGAMLQRRGRVQHHLDCARVEKSDSRSLGLTPW